MLSVASLLNPAPSGPTIHHGFPPSPAPSQSPPTSFSEELLERPTMPKHKMAKDAAVFTKGKPKGSVNFAPHEGRNGGLDEASLRQIRKYRVYPFGKIQEFCRHIPYQSEKKNFSEKTGRESFEAFQYVFKLPEDETEYTVMWDYNVGLVRMTPFFKCCKYSKTTPAKMLNMNPGLKEITHSITGGSIMAQGYWMPYHCARAVCATFCHHIAGALIPIFGPNFPSECIPPDAPEHGRMIIDPAIVVKSTKEAEYFHHMYTNVVKSVATTSGNVSPKRDRRIFRSPCDDSGRHHPRQRIRRTYVSCDSPYGTDTDGEISPATTERSTTDRYMYSSPTMPPAAPQTRPTSGWTPANVLPYYDTQPVPSPWLSAIPRFSSTSFPLHHHHHQQPQQHQHSHHQYQPQSHSYPPPLPLPHHWRPKRSAEQIDSDYEYDMTESRPTTSTTSASVSASRHMFEKPGPVEPSSASSANAAILLMNLSVRDTVASSNGRGAGAVVSETNSPVDGSFPRIKRVRANSY